MTGMAQLMAVRKNQSQVMITWIGCEFNWASCDSED